MALFTQPVGEENRDAASTDSGHRSLLTHLTAIVQRFQSSLPEGSYEDARDLGSDL